MNNHNVWCYLNNETQKKSAISLTVFGAKQFKKANIFSFLPKLEEISERYSKSTIPIGVFNKDILPYVEYWLMDSIRIIVFFENYMKAKLILADCLAHRINDNEGKEYFHIKAEQKKRPIKLVELNNIKPFSFSEEEKVVTHEALSVYTLGFNDILSRKKYVDLFSIEKDLIGFLKVINKDRNRLHFLDQLNFTLSTDFIKKIYEINDFVDNALKEYGLVYNHTE